MTRKSGYLRRKPKAKPSHRSTSAGSDGKVRLFTLMSARHLGIVGNDDRDGDGKFLVADYPVQTCIGVYPDQRLANEAYNTRSRLEGEWR